MSEMIERVARAMCIADGFDPDKDFGYYTSGVMPDPHVAQWTRYTQKARAAIEAMQEPDSVMLDAGYDISHARDGAIAYALVFKIWRAMGKAALRDQVIVNAPPPPPPDTGGLVKKGI